MLRCFQIYPQKTVTSMSSFSERAQWLKEQIANADISRTHGASHSLIPWFLRIKMVSA